VRQALGGGAGMHTSWSGSDPRGHGERALDCGAPLALDAAANVVPTRTRRGGTKVSAPTATKRAATAPARTMGGIGRREHTARSVTMEPALLATLSSGW